ncbi:hypothetical protein ANO11243_050200 [Dothideomycetidae sp. 11243]|nr:hypothetical protein ANO11243_050200 [fungal sp. No.11243]
MSASIRLQILSDLHLESPSAYDVFDIEPQCENLALLGDIGNVRDDGLFSLLRVLLVRFRLVLFVAGNHEPYHSSWVAAKDRLASFSDEILTAREVDPSLGRFVLLDRTRFDFSSSTTVLGCTLFSDVPVEKTEHISFGLNDFYHIADWSVAEHIKAHETDLQWLNTEVSRISKEEPDRRIVILTHYCPIICDQSVDPKHRNSPILSGFCTDLEGHECWTNPAVTLWAFGHTHHNCDFVDERTWKRVVTNQRGYYHDQAAGFDIKKVVDVPAL